MGIFLRFLLIAWIFTTGCGTSVTSEDQEPLISTFDIIQEQILEPNCVSCHIAGSSFAIQSDLVLTKDVAYDQLVNRPPQNQAAREDGLLLLGDTGLESLLSSFLWEKIDYPNFGHFSEDHPEYGALMPFGGPSLTYGELAFIKDWIIAGAPENGQVVDLSVLDNDDRFEIPEEDFAILAPPANGMQLHLGPFEVYPHTERELFYYQPLGTESDIYVNRLEISMRQGSHHFILYDYPEESRPEEGIYRDFWDMDNQFIVNTALTIVNQRFIFGTQLRLTDYSFPPGVALRIPQGTGFDMNSHYVNRTDDMKTGEVSVNLHTIHPNEVQFIAQNLFENYTDIFIPANRRTTLKRTSRFNEEMHIFQLTSHGHEHLEEFKVYIEGGTRDGELIYISKDWEHPLLLDYDPPIVLNPGDGLRSEATYNNEESRDLRFGLRSIDEMMILFGAYFTIP